MRLKYRFPGASPATPTQKPCRYWDSSSMKLMVVFCYLSDIPWNFAFWVPIIMCYHWLELCLNLCQPIHILITHHYIASLILRVLSVPTPTHNCLCSPKSVSLTTRCTSFRSQVYCTISISMSLLHLYLKYKEFMPKFCFYFAILWFNNLLKMYYLFAPWKETKKKNQLRID